jgi:hypothetical protein
MFDAGAAVRAVDREQVSSMDNASKARRFTINKWGLASLLLLVGDYLLWGYSFHLEDLGRPLWSRVTGLEQCVVAQVTTVVCGIVAMKRGSPWWVVTVIPAALIALSCFFGEL